MYSFNYFQFSSVPCVPQAAAQRAAYNQLLGWFRSAQGGSLGRLELGSRVPIEYQKPNGHNICMTRSGVTSTRELYCTRTVHALTVRCTVWLVLDRQTSDLLLPGQRGRCEQRPEVRRRRPLLRAQVEAQVCGAERHGLSGVITR